MIINRISSTKHTKHQTDKLIHAMQFIIFIIQEAKIGSVRSLSLPSKHRSQKKGHKLKISWKSHLWSPNYSLCYILVPKLCIGTLGRFQFSPIVILFKQPDRNMSGMLCQCSQVVGMHVSHHNNHKVPWDMPCYPHASKRLGILRFLWENFLRWWWA